MHILKLLLQTKTAFYCGLYIFVTITLSVLTKKSKEAPFSFFQIYGYNMSFSSLEITSCVSLLLLQDFICFWVLTVPDESAYYANFNASSFSTGSGNKRFAKVSSALCKSCTIIGTSWWAINFQKLFQKLGQRRTSYFKKMSEENVPWISTSKSVPVAFLLLWLIWWDHGLGMTLILTLWRLDHL